MNDSENGTASTPPARSRLSATYWTSLPFGPGVPVVLSRRYAHCCFRFCCLLICLWPASVTQAVDADAADFRKLAERIDEHIRKAWTAEEVTPAPIADDAEFHRRTWLNVAGTIPPVAEVREFLRSETEDKRADLVERLLEHPGYVNHQAHQWRSLMMPEADAEQQARLLAPGFEDWLRDRFIDNTPYDQIARELITCQVSGDNRTGPVAFIRAKGVEPENVAASVSRLFLGVQLDCAQCHDHPFSEWKREEFWGFAAFFAGIEGDLLGSLTDNTSLREIRMPDTEQVIAAQFMDRTTPQWSENDNSREVLAAWVTDKKNSQFARAGANRVWSHLFGLGLVEPPDGFDESNPASHPELLHELGAAFASHNYDIKFLIRAITATETYQRTSRRTHASQDDLHWLGRMPVKSLSPRQLSDSLLQATGVPQRFNLRNRTLNNGSAESQLVDLFANSADSVTEPETSILQALALMNGQFVTQQTRPRGSGTLSAVLQSTFMNTEQKIEALFLASVGRRPTESELHRLKTHVATHSKPEPGLLDTLVNGVKSLTQSTPPVQTAQDEALADLFWALLNSSEFLFNH